MTLQMMRVELSEKDIFCFFGVFVGLPKEKLEAALVLVGIVAGESYLELRGLVRRRGLPC